jgi:acyl-coenzyme A synthetase/AMP-(fatty) acid ligase
MSRILVDCPGAAEVAFRGPEPLTVARLRSDVAVNAARFAADDVRQALLVCDDSYNFVVGLLALFAAGADVLLPPNAQPGTVAALGDGCDCVVSDARLLSSGPELPLAALDPECCRVDFFTSGSSGTPKRIVKTLAVLERETEVLERLWGTEVGDADFLGTVSHQHIFGLTFRVLWPLYAGRRFAAAAHDLMEQLLIETTRRSVIVSSPAHLTRLAGLPPLGPERAPRLVLTAGAPLPDAALDEILRVFGILPTEIFGSTETGAIAWRRAAPDAPTWTPLPGVTVSASSEGLLSVATPFSTVPGPLALADRVELTGDGGFRFGGRSDRIVKVEGKRVSLFQLERDIVALDLVAAAAVVPLEDDHLALGAVAVLRAPGERLLEELGKFRFERLLRRELAKFYDPAVLPRRWRFVRELPLDRMGKLRVATLAALFDEEPVRARRRA